MPPVAGAYSQDPSASLGEISTTDPGSIGAGAVGGELCVPVRGALRGEGRRQMGLGERAVCCTRLLCGSGELL